MTFSAGSDHWLDQLNDTISGLGRDEFGDTLFGLVNTVVQVDHCTVFINSPDGATTHLFTKSKLDDEICLKLSGAYTQGFYVKDPNLQPFLKEQGEEITLLPHKPTDDYAPEYRDQFFGETGLIDKISSLLQTSRYNIYCSFYRLKETGPFKQGELRELSRILPLVTNLIFKHFRLADLKKDDPVITQVPLGRAPDALAHLLDGETQAFADLTAREREVCVLILKGYSSEAMSLELEVAKSTINTYRKRAYGRLGISSQNELFSLCLEFMPMG